MKKSKLIHYRAYRLTPNGKVFREAKARGAQVGRELHPWGEDNERFALYYKGKFVYTTLSKLMRRYFKKT